MPPFQACVERGRVSGLMCSYNALNGVPACANEWLLSTVARGEWGRRLHHHRLRRRHGVLSAITRRRQRRRCAPSWTRGSTSTARAASLRAMPPLRSPRGPLMRRWWTPHSPRLPRSCACNDPPSRPGHHHRQRDATAAISRIRTDGAAHATVLLKNAVMDAADGGGQRRLPLRAAGAGTVAVIGPNANLSMTLAGYYGRERLRGPWPPALAKHGGRHRQPRAPRRDGKGVLTARQTRRAASQRRRSRWWSGRPRGSGGHRCGDAHAQRRAARARRRCGGRGSAAIVVVLMTATPLDVSALLANPRVGALVHAGFPACRRRAWATVPRPRQRTRRPARPDVLRRVLRRADLHLRPGIRPGPSVWPKPTCAVAEGCPTARTPGRTYRFYTASRCCPFRSIHALLAHSSSPQPTGRAPPPPTVSLARLAAVLEATAAAGRTSSEASPQPPPARLSSLSTCA